ncbi:MAG: hypothetical protein ACPG4M_03230 [Alphaproteobacteria bacterium]
MPATPTRPRLEQIRFTSSKTGSHNIDTYLESAEIGSRTIASLLSDLFDASTNGTFRSDIFAFRTNNGILQFRVGTFTDANTGWQDLDFRVIVGRDAVTFPMATAYPSQSIFTNGSKLYISNTEIQYSNQTAFDAGETAGEVVEIFDAATLSTSALDAAVQAAEDAQEAAEDATINNQDFTDLVAQLDDIAAIASPAANLTALEAFGDSYAANNTSNAITGLNTLGNDANAVTGLTNLRNIATEIGNIGSTVTAAAIDILGNSASRAAAIDTLGASTARANAIDALGDATTSAAIDRLNQTDTSSTNNPQDTTADYIDNLGTTAMVNKLVELHNVLADIQALALKVTAIGDLGDRTTEIDALYNLRTEIDNLGDTAALNDISTVGQLSSANLSALAGEISPTNNIQTLASNISAIQDTATAVNNGTLVNKAIATDLDDILVVGPLLLS